MWIATIDAVFDNPTPSDSIFANVSFVEEGTGTTFTKSYKFTAGNVKTTDDVQAIIQADVGALDALSEVRAALEPLLKAQITAVTKADVKPVLIGPMVR